MGMKITLENNMRFQIEDKERGISFAVDQSVEEGGDNSAPTPVDLFVSSVGACVATMIGFYGKSKNIDLTGLSMDVSFEKEEKPYRVKRIDMKVHYPHDTDRKTQKIIERVAHTCIVHKSMEMPPELNLVFPWTDYGDQTKIAV